jgi:hypothetical protein
MAYYSTIFNESAVSVVVGLSFWRFLGVSFRSNIDIGFYEYISFGFMITRSVSVMSLYDCCLWFAV